jgi:hypothetical protein
MVEIDKRKYLAKVIRGVLCLNFSQSHENGF